MRNVFISTGKNDRKKEEAMQRRRELEAKHAMGGLVLPVAGYACLTGDNTSGRWSG
ncbi:hypothetical protein ACPPVO_42475 [Dactylosporangium sp. McL0621]|uniref:hypothetical protein n=1 Tax=Dactylosporangium sp. McL0621 TaxID=3415678 RepID=UPI003CF27AEE